MYIFNLFRKTPKTPEHSNSEVLEKTPDSENIMRVTPPLDLFVDNEEPALKIKSEVAPKNRIREFLNRNFHAMGVNEGFEYHSGEIMDSGKTRIRAEFQLIMDQDIQDKKERLLEMRHLIIDVKNLSESAKEKLELTIEELNASVSLLESQKELAALEEGWVMNAIHAYQQGFIQGLNDYIDGEQFLNTVKNF
jgi:hypothetical protein